MLPTNSLTESDGTGWGRDGSVDKAKSRTEGVWKRDMIAWGRQSQLTGMGQDSSARRPSRSGHFSYRDENEEARGAVEFVWRITSQYHDNSSDNQTSNKDSHQNSVGLSRATSVDDVDQDMPLFHSTRIHRGVS